MATSITLTSYSNLASAPHIGPSTTATNTGGLIDGLGTGYNLNATYNSALDTTTVTFADGEGFDAMWTGVSPDEYTAGPAALNQKYEDYTNIGTGETAPTYTNPASISTATSIVHNGTTYSNIPVLVGHPSAATWTGTGASLNSPADFQAVAVWAKLGTGVTPNLNGWTIIGYTGSSDVAAASGGTIVHDLKWATTTSPGASNQVTQRVEYQITGAALPVKFCFVAGTKISTVNGQVAVEELQVGDLVETYDNGLQEIRWIGSSSVPADATCAPILFRKGAIGNTQDLMVSPQHRMLISDWRAQVICGENEVLIAAKALVNDENIVRVEGGLVQYYHVMFDKHEIIMAEGVPSESFHPGDNNFAEFSQETRDEILAIFPDLLETSFMSYGSTARDCVREHEAKAMLGMAS